MLLRLSKNTFVRQYGPFTYVLNRLRNYDQMYTDAEVFFRSITRNSLSKKVILEQICETFPDIEPHIIESDFDEFIAPLLAERIVLAGATESEINEQEISFTYDCDNPKTFDVGHLDPVEGMRQDVPQIVLERYFAEHPTIFDLQIDITQACTERCIHCYIPEYNPIFLPYERICTVIDEFREQGGIGLTLSGGECMLHPDFDRIVRYARERDLIVGILSNLTLCDEEKVSVLSEAEATVQVSLYSMNPDVHDAITKRPGSFAKTKAAIEQLRKKQIPCFISCPTMKQNYKDYLDVLTYARGLKMDAQTDFVIMGKMNCDTSNLDCRLNLEETRTLLEDIVYKSLPINNEYFDPVKKEQMLKDEEWGNRKVCGACISSVCLDADGHYYPCPAFGGINLGSCFEHDLSWIWNESPETLRMRAVTGKDFKKCLHCPDRDYCSTCMCRNFNETGDMFKPAEHFCKVAAINHEVVDEFHKKLMRG